MIRTPKRIFNMGMELLTINVDQEAARAYQSSSQEERQKLDLLLSLKLKQALQDSRSLREVIQEISKKAQARGLTPEILQSILK